MHTHHEILKTCAEYVCSVSVYDGFPCSDLPEPNAKLFISDPRFTPEDSQVNGRYQLKDAVSWIWIRLELKFSRIRDTDPENSLQIRTAPDPK